MFNHFLQNVSKREFNIYFLFLLWLIFGNNTQCNLFSWMPFFFSKVCKLHMNWPSQFEVGCHQMFVCTVAGFLLCMGHLYIYFQVSEKKLVKNRVRRLSAGLFVKFLKKIKKYINVYSSHKNSWILASELVSVHSWQLYCSILKTC